MSNKKENESLEFIALDATKQKTLNKKHKKSKKKKNIEDFSPTRPGVVFLKHIPHGFFEPQMRSYFSQFGEVTKLRLARSKKTGKQKGYAYIEFSCDEVAKVVADTMNNYLMFERCLKCEVVPPDLVHPNTFRGANRRHRRPNSRTKAIQNYEKRSMDSDKVAERKLRSDRKRKRLQGKLSELGIEYDISDLGTIPDFIPPPRREASKEEETEKKTTSSIREEFERMMDEYDEECENDIKAQVNKLLDQVPEDDEEDSGIDHETEESVDEEDAPDESNAHIVDMKGISLDITPEMLIDPDDDEVTFKTPPETSRVKKRSLPSLVKDEVTPKRRSLKTGRSELKKSARKRQLMEMRKMLNMTM